MVREWLRRTLPISEGLRLIAYLCSRGYWTLGIGRNLEARGYTKEAASKMTCTESEAYAWLDDDIDKTLTECEKVPTFLRLNKARQAAIADMVFNMGMPKVLAFRDMWAAIAAEDFERAAVEIMDSKYALDVGDGVGGRFDRAERNALMMQTGEFH